MQEKRLELSWYCYHTDLNRTRLPIPPFLHTDRWNRMRKMGLEPTRHCCRKILSLARLPVPTLPHCSRSLHEVYYHFHFPMSTTICKFLERRQSVVNHLLSMAAIAPGASFENSFPVEAKSSGQSTWEAESWRTTSFQSCAVCPNPCKRTVFILSVAPSFPIVYLFYHYSI